MTFYHVTDFRLWEKKIRKQGLRIYDLGPNVQYWSAYAPDIKEGIWLWPDMDEKLMRECFLFQRCSKWITKVAILKCEVEEKAMLSELILSGFPKAYRAELTHNSWFEFRGNRHGHDREPFDISLFWIQPEKITLYAVVEEVVTMVKT